MVTSVSHTVKSDIMIFCVMGLAPAIEEGGGLVVSAHTTRKDAEKAAGVKGNRIEPRVVDMVRLKEETLAKMDPITRLAMTTQFGPHLRGGSREQES